MIIHRICTRLGLLISTRLGLILVRVSASSNICVTSFITNPTEKKRITGHFQLIPFVQAVQIHQVRPKRKEMKDMRSDKMNEK